MTSRERLQTTLAGKIPDRIPMLEISFWPETITRWRKEGLPEGVDITDYLGLDVISCHCPFDCSLRLPPKLIEENERYKIETNSDGVTIKSSKTSYVPPVEIDFQIQTLADWNRVKESFNCLPERFRENAAEAYQAAKNKDQFLAITPIEPIWYIIRTLGFERSLIAMVSEPDFIDDMLSTCTDFMLKMLTLTFAKGFKYDALWFFADLCYKNGMLFSPRLYKEMFQKYHMRIKKWCQENNMFFILHCDGDVREFIPLLIETGFDCIQPLEARAGNDVRELKKKYGKKICFFGNINMDVLARGRKKEISEEVITKVEAAKAGGGYIYHSDHSVPPTVSLENYVFALELAKKYGKY